MEKPKARYLFCLFLITTVVLATGAIAQEAAGPPSEGRFPHGKRPFTVADSIEMTHLIDPSEGNQEPHPKCSPDGKKFLIVTERGDLNSNTRVYSLFVYDLAQLNRLSPPVVTLRSSSNRDGILAAKWLDDNYISFIGENPGEIPQVYLLDWRRKKLEKLTAAPSGVLAYDISYDHKKVVYYANWLPSNDAIKLKEEHGFAVEGETLFELLTDVWKTPTAEYQLYILDRRTGKARPSNAGPIRVPEGRLHIAISPNGHYAVTEQPAFAIDAGWVEYDDPFLQWLVRDRKGIQEGVREQLSQAMYVNLETGEIKPLIDAPLATLMRAAWTTDGRFVYLTGTYLPLNISDPEERSRRKSHSAVVQIEIPERRVQKISEVPKDEDWRLLTSDASGGFTLAESKQVESDIYKQLPNVHFFKVGGQWTQEPGNPDAGANITIAEAIDRRPKLVIRDQARHQDKVIYDPNSQLDHFQFGRVEVIHWTGDRNEALTGGLVYPTNYNPGTKYPLVIQTHGFDPYSFLTDGPFTSAFAAQELANKGIAVLQLGDGPLSDPSEGTPDFGPVNLSQFESAISYLEKLGIVDADRVGLTGFSVTGFAVRYALQYSKYHYLAATSTEGSDWGYFTYICYLNNYERSQYEAPYGGPPWKGNWKTWLDQSVSFNYDKFHTPLRLESDSNPGEVLNEWESFVALRRLNKPVELIYVPHGDHPVVKPFDRMTSQQGNVDWMSFWLKEEEDPDPNKAAQYERWRKLRVLQRADMGDSKTQESVLEPDVQTTISH